MSQLMVFPLILLLCTSERRLTPCIFTGAFHCYRTPMISLTETPCVGTVLQMQSEWGGIPLTGYVLLKAVEYDCLCCKDMQRPGLNSLSTKSPKSFSTRLSFSLFCYFQMQGSVFVKLHEVSVGSFFQHLRIFRVSEKRLCLSVCQLLPFIYYSLQS